jgi:hypothetical protein
VEVGSLFAFHGPLERSRDQAAILKSMGTVAGVPDLIELKSANGRLSDDQNRS